MQCRAFNARNHYYVRTLFIFLRNKLMISDVTVSTTTSTLIDESKYESSPVVTSNRNDTILKRKKPNDVLQKSRFF